MRFFVSSLSALLLGWSVSSWPAAQINLPADSLFHSAVQLSDQKSAPFVLGAQRGNVQIVAFVYTHCISVCPVIIADLQRLDSMLSPAIRAQVQYVLITLDADNDTADARQHFLDEHGINDPRWHFVRASNDDTRELALLFDVRYRQDATEIAHSNMISVLDTQGVLSYQRKGSGALEAVVGAISQALASAKNP